MANVTQISQYLFRKDPQKTLVRLSFYHFLKNASESSKIVNFQFFQEFVERCFNFPYWQERQTQFQQEFTPLIQELQELPGIEISEEQKSILNNLQVISIRTSREFEIILKTHLKELSALEQHKLIITESNHFLALSLLSSGGIKVRLFQPICRVINGKLVPIDSISELEYTSYMELMPGQNQRLQVNELKTAQFFMEDGICHGKMIQGYHFQNGGTVETQSLGAVPELYHGIKALERYFINPSSDPFYRELVDQLEKVYHLLNENNSVGLQMAPPLLKKGKEALRNIFQKDKLLLLLVNNIDYMLNRNSISRQPVQGSSNQWQNVKPLPQ